MLYRWYVRELGLSLRGKKEHTLMMEISKVVTPPDSKLGMSVGGKSKSSRNHELLPRTPHAFTKPKVVRAQHTAYSDISKILRAKGRPTLNTTVQALSPPSGNSSSLALDKTFSGSFSTSGVPASASPPFCEECEPMDSSQAVTTGPCSRRTGVGVIVGWRDMEGGFKGALI